MLCPKDVGHRARARRQAHEQAVDSLARDVRALARRQAARVGGRGQRRRALVVTVAAVAQAVAVHLAGAGVCAGVCGRLLWLGHEGLQLGVAAGAGGGRR